MNLDFSKNILSGKLFWYVETERFRILQNHKNKKIILENGKRYHFFNNGYHFGHTVHLDMP